MATQDLNAPRLGAQGEPCVSCGGPLAGDQRYCLQCGTRRAEARIAFREILARPSAPAPGSAIPPSLYAPAPAAAAEPPARTGLTFLAGLACLLLALGVGVLIGRSGNDGSPTAAKAPAPQVISVGGAAPAATTTTDATAGSDSGSSSSDSSGEAKSTKSSSGGKASSKALGDLSKKSGADYQKQADKLPKEVGTSGAPAKIDKSKPAGAGSDMETIG
jgi:hypothetical protein